MEEGGDRVIEATMSGLSGAAGTIITWAVIVLVAWFVLLIIVAAIPGVGRIAAPAVASLPIRVIGPVVAVLISALAAVLGKVVGRGAFEVLDLPSRVGRVNDPDAPLVRFEERRPMDNPPTRRPGRAS